MLQCYQAGRRIRDAGAVHPVHFMNQALSVILYVMYSIPRNDEPFPRHYEQLITTGGDGASTELKIRKKTLLQHAWSSFRDMCVGDKVLS
jgi:hypothetical protein